MSNTVVRSSQGYYSAGGLNDPQIAPVYL